MRDCKLTSEKSKQICMQAECTQLLGGATRIQVKVKNELRYTFSSSSSVLMVVCQKSF